jgi:4-aminobutyrate aminotransferase-like enzyme
MDAVAPGGLGGTFGGNPVACAAAAAVLDAIAEPDFQGRSQELGRALRAGLDGIASRVPAVGEVRGLGPMLALELTELSPALAAATVDAAYDRGLLLLSCGLYGNVLRLLPPLTVADEDVETGLELLEESLVAAGARTS